MWAVTLVKTIYVEEKRGRGKPKKIVCEELWCWGFGRSSYVEIEDKGSRPL